MPRLRRRAPFYTALGHKGIYWDEPKLLAHVLGGIEMAAGVKKFDNCE